VKKSTIVGAGKGLFAKQALCENTKLGEYTGTITYDHFNEKSDYVFKVRLNRKNHAKYKYIDAADTDCILRYVNGADAQNSPNVYSYQYREKIYFKTLRPIKKDEELIVDYGDEYEL
jgi:SET domain-containing protein